MELKKKVFTDIADFNNAISSQAAELSAQIKPSAASTGSISKGYQHWADGDAAKGTSGGCPNFCVNGFQVKAGRYGRRTRW